MTTITSRTGLVPTQKKNFKLIQKHKSRDEDQLPKRFEATPIALSLRPFGGLYNPYAKGCSVLCNHPAPSGVRDIINQLKHTLNTEGKAIQLAKEKLDAVHFHETDNIPEDLFRRYTDTDSRPLTPSPTVTSIHTRTSAGSFLNRRCITPEFGKSENNKRKKIILDLRRSHSQETLYWKPTSDISQNTTGVPETDKQKAKSAGADLERRSVRLKSEEQRSKSSLATANIPDETGEGGVEKKSPHTCINEQVLDDEDVRRGKKRKKIKAAATTTTSFRQHEDPETQVGALGPDSLNASTRASLIPTASLLPNKEKRESEPVLIKGSFLTDEAFQALKSEVNVDTIENTFGRYLNYALREAFKYMPPKPKSVEEITEDIEKLSCAPASKMPRKFSKSATRFEAPLNLSALETMTVIEYLSKYVWVSKQRKQLYKRVFLKYLTHVPTPVQNEDLAPIKEELDAQIQPIAEYVERTMSAEHLPQALEDVMEFYGSEENITGILRIIDYENIKKEQLNFRTWCGFVSFAERYAQDEQNNTDSCDELEKVDFFSMLARLADYNVPESMQEVFRIIKRCHFMTD